MQSSLGLTFLLVTSIIYGIALAIPYLPSIEVGYILMVIFGQKGILCVYLATTFGLLTAYLIGQNLQAKTLLPRLINIPIIDSLKVPSYLTLIILLNTPGNVAIGGGGGIAMNFGHHKRLGVISFIFWSLLGTLPLPLLMFINSRG